MDEDVRHVAIQTFNAALGFIDPGLASVLLIVQAFVGASNEAHKSRILEWAEDFKNNPSLITPSLMSSQNFQDGLTKAMIKSALERSEIKRATIRGVFLGYCKSGCAEDFEIEKFLDVLDRLSLEDVKVLKIYVDGSVARWISTQPVGAVGNSALETAMNVFQIGALILAEICGEENFRNAEYTYERVNYLVGIGLMRSGFYNGAANDLYLLSDFGKKFIQLITDPQIPA